MIVGLYKLKRFGTTPWVFFNIIATILLQIFIWGYLYVNYRYYDASTFLHYSVGVGVDLVGIPNQLFTIPATGLVIALANTILAFFLYERNRVGSIFLMFLTNLLHVFLTITTLLIVSLNV